MDVVIIDTPGSFGVVLLNGRVVSRVLCFLRERGKKEDTCDKRLEPVSREKRETEYLAL